MILAIAGGVIYSSGVFPKKPVDKPAASSSTSGVTLPEATRPGFKMSTSDTPVVPQKPQDVTLSEVPPQLGEGLSSLGPTHEGDDFTKLNEGTQNTPVAENETPSTLIPPLVIPPSQEGAGGSTGKDGKVVRVTVGESLKGEQNTSTILGTTSISDGTLIPSSQDTVIPLTIIQKIAHDLVNGYWPHGTHVLATSKGVTTTSFAFLNTRYGTRLSGKFSTYAETGLARQGLLDYILMPSMVDGLYKLYAERFIRLVNQEAGKRVYTRHEATVNLSSQEVGEMYGLYAGSLRTNAGCIRGFVDSGEIRQAAEEFILAEQEASEAHMNYQEHFLDAENAGVSVSHKVEQQYRLKVAERESARQNLASAFRRFTDTRNMDTSDLVFLAKWLNRRSKNHNDGLLALATTLENLAARMEREQQRYIKQ